MRLEVRDVDRLRQRLGHVPQEVRLPRPDRPDQERVAPARDVGEEPVALGGAPDQRQLRRERSHGSASFGRGHCSPA